MISASVTSKNRVHRIVIVLAFCLPDVIASRIIREEIVKIKNNRSIFCSCCIVVHCIWGNAVLKNIDQIPRCAIAEFRIFNDEPRVKEKTLNGHLRIGTGDRDDQIITRLVKLYV